MEQLEVALPLFTSEDYESLCGNRSFASWSLEWLKPHTAFVQANEQLAIVNLRGFSRVFSSQVEEESFIVEAPRDGYLCQFRKEKGSNSDWHSGDYGCFDKRRGIGALLEFAKSDEIIYIKDTSFLMSEDPDHDSGQFDLSITESECQKALCEFDHWIVPYALNIAGKEMDAAICQLRRKIVRKIVPLEVKREIHSHFSDAEKAPKARRARNFLARLLADTQASERELANENEFPLIESELGPDSKVDKQILYYALNQAQTGRGCFVATKDGGIRLEIVKQWKKTRMPIFCESNLHAYRAFLDSQTVWLLGQL